MFSDMEDVIKTGWFIGGWLYGIPLAPARAEYTVYLYILYKYCKYGIFFKVREDVVTWVDVTTVKKVRDTYAYASKVIGKESYETYLGSKGSMILLIEGQQRSKVKTHVGRQGVILSGHWSDSARKLFLDIILCRRYGAFSSDISSYTLCVVHRKQQCYWERHCAASAAIART
jgi:hypothetical protein